MIYPIRLLARRWKYIKVLGPGLLESVYEDALCVELEGREISYERQKDVSIWYKVRTIGNLRVDWASTLLVGS